MATYTHTPACKKRREAVRHERNKRTASTTAAAAMSENKKARRPWYTDMLEAAAGQVVAANARLAAKGHGRQSG